LENRVINHNANGFAEHAFSLQERLLDVIIPVSAIVISFYGSLWELHREPTQDFAVKTFRIGSFPTAEADLPQMGWQNEREFHNRILPPGCYYQLRISRALRTNPAPIK
jgi:hypothetical protein